MRYLLTLILCLFAVSSYGLESNATAIVRGRLNSNMDANQHGLTNLAAITGTNGTLRLNAAGNAVLLEFSGNGVGGKTDSLELNPNGWRLDAYDLYLGASGDHKIFADGSQLINLPAISKGGAVTNSAVIYVYPDGTAWGSNAVITTTGTRTAGIQEAIDYLYKVSGIFSGVGGGKLVLAPGTFRCFTNIVIPNYFPFCLRMEGAGFNGTIIQGEGSGACTNTALFSCATNHINGLRLTNGLTLFVSDATFCHTNETQTNFLWNITGQTWAKFEDCVFTSQQALLHGQGGYSMNFEANYPNQPIGLVGLAASKDTDDANSQLDVRHSFFWALACGAVANPVMCRIADSHFVNCGSFSTVAPPGLNGDAETFTHTNLWKGAGVKGSISTGAALVLGYNTPNFWITDNHFLYCGAMAAIGTDNGFSGAAGHVMHFRGNILVGPDSSAPYHAECFRILSADYATASDIETIDPASGPPGARLRDSLVTNGPAGNPVIQPSAAPLTVPIPTLWFMHTGIAGDADSWFEFGSGDVSGGPAPRIIGNGLGLTNVPSHWTGNPNQFGSANSFTNIISGAPLTNITIRGDGTAGMLAQYLDHNQLIVSNANASLIISNDANGAINLRIGATNFALIKDPTTITLGYLNFQTGNGTVAGGLLNTNASGTSFIGGGESNLIALTQGGQVLGGGFQNIIGPYNLSANPSFLGGGSLNTISNGSGSVLVGGNANYLDKGSSTTAFGSTIGGGDSNTNTAQYATITGGRLNKIAADYGAISGGRSNTVSGANAWAGGYRAIAGHQGAYTWGDSTDTAKASSAANTYNVFASGGTFINSGPLTVANVLASTASTPTLTVNASALVTSSSIRGSENWFEIHFVLNAATQQANSNYFTITLPTSYSANAVIPIAGPAGTNSSTGTTATKWTFYGTDATHVQVYSGPSAPTASFDYGFGVMVGRY